MSDFDNLDAAERAAVDEPVAPPRTNYPSRRGCSPSHGDDGTRERLQQPHLLDYLRVLYRRRWVAVTTFTVIMLVVAVYTFTSTPVYEATTKLLIDAENPNVVNFKQVIDEPAVKTDYYQTQYNLLQSRTLARRTMDTMKLWDLEEFGAAPTGNRFSFADGLDTWFTSVVSVFRPKDGTHADVEAATAFAEVNRSRAVDLFLSRLNVSPVRNSRIVDVKFRSADPALAARVVNTLAAGFIEQSLDYKFLSSKGASDWLADQLSNQRRQVERAEAALQRYKEANGAIALEDRQNIYVQKLEELNTAVTRAKTDRIEKEAVYNQLHASQANRATVDAAPAVLANAFIQGQKSEVAELQRQLAALSEKLGDKHPELIRTRSALHVSETKLSAEIAKLVQSIENQYLAAQAEEHTLMAAFEAQKREALAMNRKSIEYGVLQREVESSRQIYDRLLQRAKETGVSAELKMSNVRIIDAAEAPLFAASPRTALNLILALLGGSMLGIALAFFREYVDSRIRTPGEMRAHLGTRPLGVLPAVPKRALNGGYPLVSNGVPPTFSEAVRAIRTNVLFSWPEEGSRSILVTSTGPGEGKTILAVNLAVSLAQAGQRVLLIDADMRKPEADDAFGVDREPGLSNLLVGTARASESLHKTAVTGLWLLPAGKVPSNPSELLGLKRFRELLDSLRQHFDWVVIDSPPVMAVIDGAIVAQWASGVVFIVGAEMTSRDAAKAALDQLDNAKARVVGAVLNRVRPDGAPYRYPQYHPGEYGQHRGVSQN